MKILLIIIITLFYSIKSYSKDNLENWGTLCLDDMTLVSSPELEPFGIEHRLAIAEFDKKRLENLLEKIPRLNPDKFNWIEEEFNSSNRERRLKVQEYPEFHQYYVLDGLKDIIVILNQIIMTTNNIIEVKMDELTNHEKSLWIYYSRQINNYQINKSLSEIYINKIIDKPYFSSLESSLKNCMTKANHLLNIIKMDTYKHEY